MITFRILTCTHSSTIIVFLCSRLTFFLSLSFFTYFLFSLLCPAFNLVWHPQRLGKQTAVSRPVGLLLPPQSFYYLHTHKHKRTHRNLCMIAQSHINTVNLALLAPTAAHDSPCQFGLRPRRKPFPVVPGWSEAARPGVLCSHSLCRGEAGRAEPSRPGSYLQAHPRTPWYRDPTSPLHRLVYTCLTLRQHIAVCSGTKVDSQNFRHLWPSFLSLTLTRHNCCLALHSPCTLVLRKCLITARVGPNMLQAETHRTQCGQCFSLSPSPPSSRRKHHAILTCCSAASPEKSL